MDTSVLLNKKKELEESLEREVAKLLIKFKDDTGFYIKNVTVNMAGERILGKKGGVYFLTGIKCDIGLE